MDITDKLNMTMLCDFYELTMGNGYLEAGLKDRIPYLHTDFPAGLHGSGNGYHSLRYHDDFQPVYRNHHTSGRYDLVRGC